MGFAFCTYNIGKGFNDYKRLDAYNKNLKIKSDNANGGLPSLSRDEAKELRNQFNKNQNQVANTLKDKAQVFCLQEVTPCYKNGREQNRPLINSLSQKNYEIVYADEINKRGCVVAFDKTRFSLVKNVSLNVKLREINKIFNAAIAVAKDKLTNNHVIFVSVHAPGFDLTNPNITTNDTKTGDEYCKQVINHLKTIEKAYKPEPALTIIGGDLNANPKKGKTRFKIFREAGFILKATNQPTNVNPVIPLGKNSQPLIERELDFIFVKSQDSANTQFKAKIQSCPVKWENNASDHLPIIATISEVAKKNTHYTEQQPNMLLEEQATNAGSSTFQFFTWITNWRNDTIQNKKEIKAKVIAEAGYALIAIVSLVEWMARFVFTTILMITNNRIGNNAFYQNCIKTSETRKTIAKNLFLRSGSYLYSNLRYTYLRNL